MNASIVYLLVLVFTQPGATKPTVNITVTRDEVACELSRVAVQKASTFPLLVAQCAPFDLAKAGEVAKGRR